jgi:pimeloyl-ACP methyl ester carboxylesterase
MTSALHSRTVHADGLDFGILEVGTGPLALCLHGFPDTAHTWRHLLPDLADAGFHAVAPFMRGYAPTAIPDDGCYHLGALVADAVALHDVLGGDSSAVLIGHDWGAEAAYGAAAYAPDRWRRLVTLAIPPLTRDEELFADYDQLKRFFYLFYFEASPSADDVVWRDQLAFLHRLWEDWSPGYDPRTELGFVAQALPDRERLAAALDYYRTSRTPIKPELEAHQAALALQPSQPTLYLHGENDGCVLPRFAAGAERHLAPQSRVELVQGVGHFLQVERPREVNARILHWLVE